MLLLLVLAGRATILAQTDIQLPFHHEAMLHTAGTDSTWNLPHRYLMPGTVSVRLDSIELSPDEFFVDCIRGVLSLRTRPDSGQVVVARYRFLPWSLHLSHAHWVESKPDSHSLSPQPQYAMRAASPPLNLDPAPGLSKSGSIFRGLSLGTTGMRLQSGLRLQLSGDIVPGVEVVASLTDQNIPIQPEGNTQTLQEIDKVFVTIQAGNLHATLGDYFFENSGTVFGTYSRKLQGVMGRADTRAGNFTIFAAASKGEFTTNHFQGQEGNQGPYQLTGALGQREIIVLAGTERVWVDGLPMTRGENHDYIIEYGNGQVTFTRHRLISEESRIAVDFEYSDQKFRKMIVGMTGETTFFKDRVTLRTAFLSETDDKNQPLDIPLTDDDLDILAAAGDQADSAATSGAVYVGENKGYYTRIDSGGVIFYRYAGTLKGDYVVRFSYIGTAQGDYSFQGYGIYRYEGPGQGDYLPRVYLPLAVKHQMVDVAADVSLGRRLSLSAEAALSHRDFNLYSPLDDDDNNDAAYTGRLRLNQQPLPLGTVDLSASWRNVGERFRPVGRSTEVEHGRKWGTDEGEVWGETSQELSAVYAPLKAWQWRAEWGDFRRGDAFQSRRRVWGTDLTAPKWPELHALSEEIQTEKQGLDGQWNRQSGSVQMPLWIFTPGVHYQAEHRRDAFSDTLNTGFRYRNWSGSLLMETGGASFKYTRAWREDEQYRRMNLSPYAVSSTDQVEMSAQKWGAQLTLLYTHRLRDYESPGLTDQKTDLADMKLSYTPPRRWMESSVNYRFSSTQVSQMVRDTIDVGPGLGNYRLDETLNELVPDPDGNLLVRTLQTGQFVPVNELRMGGDIRFDPERLFAPNSRFAKWFSGLSSRGQIRIERRDKTRNFLKVNRRALSPRWGQDSSLVMGQIYWLQDVEYQTRDGWQLRLRHRRTDAESYQLLREGSIRHDFETGFRVKGRFSKTLGITAELIQQGNSKTFTVNSRTDREIAGWKAIGDLSWRADQRLELALKFRWQDARDRHPDPATRGRALFVLPRFRYSFLNRGQLRAELEAGRITASPKSRSLPYEMFNGDQPGNTLRWTVLMTYRLSGHVTATLNYRGRREPWRDDLFQMGQVEIRAFF